MGQSNSFAQYPLPSGLIIHLAWDALLHRRRSFHSDALDAVHTEGHPWLLVEGREHIPTRGARLITLNHYSRPGLGVWWGALAISALLPGEVHWMMAGRWNYRGGLAHHTLQPLTAWAFHRVAQVYDFTAMPPMPPDPRERAERGLAVRRLVEYVRRMPQPLLAFAPEGGDSPDGRLGEPPPGAGRLVSYLCRLGLEINPVGVYEEAGQLCLKFGPAYCLEEPAGSSAQDADRQVSHQIMRAIARLVPPSLRGEYG